MVNDAQLESPPNVDVRDNEEPNCTNENNISNSVRVVENRVNILQGASNSIMFLRVFT